MYPRKYVIHTHTHTHTQAVKFNFHKSYTFRLGSHSEYRRQQTDHIHIGSFGLRPVGKDKSVKLHIKCRLSNVHVINIIQTEIISNTLDEL